MGIINWMQNRFNGKHEKRRPEAAAISSARESCRQDHAREDKIPNGDWPPQGLLSIGTLGDDPPPAAGDGGGGPPRASQADVLDFTIEEVKKLQDALNKLLRRAKSKSSSSRGSGATDEDRASQLPLDRFLNCPSSLEVDRRISLRHAAGDSGGENGEAFSPDTQIILSKARDLLVNSNGTTIKKKSFKFLLKKMFVCHGGFAPAPSLKDPVESRMEKLFRTMLQKKMNARPSNAAVSSRKYYLDDKPSGRRMIRDGRHDEEDDEKGSDRIKWDKTDTDFIVLEI
ncbi:protein NEGATIVE GRAVITROPIC RESPONSE OF ROOTS-like [Miscanthus floridulus]|uniref:protein NEGATIVE GRAVITROPIC RESPONSE OF ROOTS-like n=1 Tax=Miscanthus floridulus TaxID=154761 RepID=UPI003458DA9D